MLTLPIKKKWFDMIKSGEKKEEYREIKPYWTRRFEKLIMMLKPLSEIEENYLMLPKDYNVTTVLFRNGYGNSVPTIKCKVKIYCDYGLPKWGAEKGKKYYVLKILSVEEI